MRESESQLDSEEEFLLPGTVVGGRYQIAEVLAWGGMGIVYRAVHLELGSEVAVKTMRRRLVNDDDAYERFVREARNTAQLKTSRVAKVFDFGRAGDGRPYLVMELLHGEALSARIKRGPLTNEETANILIQACSGLADAHECGIVHRDLKPDNLFLSDREDRGSELKLLDFGVAKSGRNLTPFPRSLTLSGGAVGSPSYMAPEQMHSREDLDQRADIWALGAVAYEGLAGEPAFDGKTLTAICAKVLTEAPRPLSELRDDVWPELEVAISRCLQRAPEHRFQNVLELSQALELALEAHDVKRSGRASELVAEPLAAPVQVLVSVGVVDCVAETEANLDVSLELAQISGFRKRRWPQRLALLTGLGVVAAGVWITFTWENRLVSLHRGGNLELSPVVVAEAPIVQPALAVSAAAQPQVQAPQPIAVDPPRAARPVSRPAPKVKSVGNYAIAIEPTAVEPPATPDAAVEIEPVEIEPVEESVTAEDPPSPILEDE